jgi:hypothetical protein
MLKSVLPKLPRPLRLAALRLITTPRQITPGLTYGIARTPEEIDGAAQLVHDAYVGARMIAPQASERWHVPRLRQPRALVIVAKDRARVVGTIGAVADGPLGLPMDAVHPNEMAARRHSGRLMIEACATAVDPAYRHGGVQFLMGVVLLHVARNVLGGDDLVATVKPSAADFYAMTLTLAPFTPIRKNLALGPHVPSLGLAVALDTLEERLRRRDRFWPQGALNQHWVYFRHPWPGVERAAPQEALASQRMLLSALANCHVEAVSPTVNVASTPADLRAS